MSPAWDGNLERAAQLSRKPNVQYGHSPGAAHSAAESISEPACAKERFCNDPLPNEFSRALALRNGIALFTQMATPLCNAGRFCPRLLTAAQSSQLKVAWRKRRVRTHLSRERLADVGFSPNSTDSSITA